MTARLVCHCLLIESNAGLILVDSGLGMGDVSGPADRLSGFFRKLLRPRLDPDETALRHVERLGFWRGDVRHIVLTHLDFDHAGGLEDFPGAQVHTLAAEHQAASFRRTFLDRARYRPMQWNEQINWNLYSADGERWFGFDAVRDLRGIPPELLMVPLVGHTRGHAGVAVRRGEGWLLLAGDAYFHSDEMPVQTPLAPAAQPRCPPGLAAYQKLMEVDRKTRLANQDRLRKLAREQQGALRIVCSHDADELARCQAEAPTTHADSRPRQPPAGDTQLHPS